jgi:hypothetical protein
MMACDVPPVTPLHSTPPPQLLLAPPRQSRPAPPLPCPCVVRSADVEYKLTAECLKGGSSHPTLSHSQALVVRQRPARSPASLTAEKDCSISACCCFGGGGGYWYISSAAAEPTMQGRHCDLQAVPPGCCGQSCVCSFSADLPARCL